MKKYTNKKKTAITIAFMGILGLCAVMGMSQKEYKSTYASVDPNTKAVFLDTDNDIILLNQNEFDNYVFVNLYNALIIENDNEYGYAYTLFYGSNDNENWTSYASFSIYSENTIQWENNNNLSIQLASNGHFYSLLDDFSYYRFSFADSSNYENVVSAIELDIQTNEPESQGDSIMSAITSGMGLAPDVANEFLKGFTAVFWDSTNSTLTRVSNFMLVMLGIAMVMAIIKLSLSLIRSNTGA